MSRFTRPPFHKPSPFDIPRPAHPLSPPETELTADSIPLPSMSIVSRDRDMGPSSFADMGASSSFTRVDTPENHHPTVVAADTTQTYAQSQNGRFRPRPPNLGYLHHPGSVRGDLRSAPRSATRWLVMVIPPPAIAREHGTGTFLNASSRSSQGVLLPLLPSLSGQLTAIAREFAFPSTTGICIYLQMSDGGVQFAPRISDESWSILWGAAFDERQSMATMGGLPVAGRIEFDLDLRKARWFDMWLSSLRNSVDLGSSIGGPGSYAANHRREDSRTTTFETAEDSVGDEVSVTIQRKVPVIRHVPRKLSLLDRVDISSTKPLPKPTSRVALSPTDAEQPRLTLSPVIQTPIAVVPVQVPAEEDSSDEPRTATLVRRVDVERKVENWRASSSFAKSPLVAFTGQTALDPANMPNNQPLVETDALEPLNLDDFTWSISSAGPLSVDYRDDIPLFDETDRPSSVHLDARLEGSVCLTPTTCTSWGPPDYDYFSAAESVTSRLPSPDIAARQYDDVPPTPSTATSWGPPSEWPGSPANSLFRAPSIDLAAREQGSRPVTPCTATSWGAPLDWPESPTTPFRVQTPGVGTMFFDGMDEEDALLETSRALYASVSGDKEPFRLLQENDEVGQTSKPWKFVWPYHQAETVDMQKPVSLRLLPKYPCISLYPAVYPHFDLYPAPAALHMVNDEQPSRRRDLHSHGKLVHAPVAKPWRHVWPYQQITNDTRRQVSVRIESTYPSFDLYPAVYPHFDLYPAKPLLSVVTREVGIRLKPKYPLFSIYPAVYPNFEIYPGHVVEAQKNPQGLISVQLEPEYPCIRPYPAVYPYFELYPMFPAKSARIIKKRQPPRKQASPSHTQQSETPKASPWKHVWPYQHIEDVSRPVTTRLETKYPSFNIYPAVYPHFDLYPAKPPAFGANKEVSVKLAAKYPAFSIYPAVYPTFEIYPGHVVETQKDPREQLSVQLRSSYPSVEIYTPVYPHLVIYPEVAIKQQLKMSRIGDGKTTMKAACKDVFTRSPISVTLENAYPNLDIYPAVYPYFDIYRSGKASTPGWNEPPQVVLNAKYPILEIYPPVYPYFDIYRSGKASTPEWHEPPRVALHSKYPTLEIYPPVYPYFDIYKSGQVSDPTPLTNKLTTKFEAKYPALDIYPAVYPNFELYPSIRPVMRSSSLVARRRPRKTHQELVNIVLANRPRPPIVPRISISSHETRRHRPRRTHAQLVELVLSKHKHEVTPRVRRSADVPQDVSEPMNSTSPTSRRVSRPSGIPVRPPEMRRSVSLGQATMSSSPGISRSQSLRHLPSVREETVGSRMSSSLQRGQHTPSLGHIAERKPVKRDSIVLEKARHWGATVAESNSRPIPRPLDNSSRVTIQDLSEFPMPPLPPVPGLPSSNPNSSLNGRTMTPAATLVATQRPIAKLDRTKFPFR